MVWRMAEMGIELTWRQLICRVIEGWALYLYNYMNLIYPSAVSTVLFNMPYVVVYRKRALIKVGQGPSLYICLRSIG